LAASPLALSGCSGAAQKEEPTPTPYPTPIVPTKPTYTVQRGTVVREVEFNGRVAPVVDQALFFRVNGFVRQVNLKRDDTVTAGQVLAELEVADLEKQIATAQLQLKTNELQLATARQAITDTLTEAQIALESAQMRYAQSSVENTAVNITITAITLSRAQTAVIDATREYTESLERQASWREREEVVKRYADALTRAQQELAIAQAQHEQAIATHTARTYAAQILAQDAKLAQLRVDKLKRGVDSQLVQNVELARLNLQRLEAQLTDARLVAPFKGKVTILSIDKGNQVTAFKSVAVVADLSSMEVGADLTSADLANLAEGMAATAEPVGRPGAARLINGTIRRIPTLGAAAKVGDIDQSTRVKLEKEPEQLGLALGDVMRVKVELEKKDNVLWLPPAAVRTFEGRRFVVVQDGQVLRRVDVRLGIVGKERVEILEGLSEGQIIQAP